jgi:glycosyltransferase involved in cell wall biosynthesis
MNSNLHIYNNCDIFVLPSYTTGTWEELFGITIIEAMS